MWHRSAARLLALAGRGARRLRPHIRDGNRLDPQLRAALALAPPLANPRLHALGPERARIWARRAVRLTDPPARPVDVHPGPMVGGAAGPLPSRVYRPRGVGGPLPGLMYIHGGGFVIGDLDTHDAICQHLAHQAGCAVLAVTYRLAPEHRFPAAYDDAVAAWAWLLGNAAHVGMDPARLAVGGDSAGGNLSAGVAIAARDHGLQAPALQLLIYPGTELRRATRSHRAFDGGYMLTGDVIDWFLAQYQPDADDPRASPLLAEDLSGLAPAHVVLAGFDPLQDEGRAYARRLAAEGTRTSIAFHPGLGHLFIHTTAVVDAARRAVDEMAVVLRDHLAQR